MSTRPIKAKTVDSILDQHYIYASEGNNIGIAQYEVLGNGAGFAVVSGMSQIRNNTIGSISITSDGVPLDSFAVYQGIGQRSVPQTTFRTQEDRTGESDPSITGPFYLSNTFFINTSGNYLVRSLVDNVKIYDTSANPMTPLATISSAFGTATLTGLSAGDRLYAKGPISISLNTSGQEGTIPVYGGWAGFTFATTMDRGSGVSLSIFTLDDTVDGTDVDIYSTTSASSSSYNTSDLTRVASWRDQAPETRLTYAMSTTNYYYIVANKPVCVYRGDGQDKMPLFPMYPNEQLYGFFSQQGHIQSTQSALSLTKGPLSVSNAAISMKNSSGGTASVPNLSSPTAPYVYTDTSMPAAMISGADCSGPAVKVEANTSGYNMSIGAESQGDGAGSDMFPLVGSRALGCAQIITTPLFYLACVANSAGSFHIIDSSDNVVETVQLTGNATNGVYHGRSTTTANLVAGNRFEFFDSSGDYINSAQFFGDYGTSTKEETVFYMVRANEFKEVPLTFTYQISGSAANSENACAASIEVTTITITENSRGDINAATGEINNTGLDTSLASGATAYYKASLIGSTVNIWVQIDTSSPRQVISTGICGAE